MSVSGKRSAPHGGHDVSDEPEAKRMNSGLDLIAEAAMMVDPLVKKICDCIYCTKNDRSQFRYKYRYVSMEVNRVDYYVFNVTIRDLLNFLKMRQNSFSIEMSNLCIMITSQHNNKTYNDALLKSIFTYVQKIKDQLISDVHILKNLHASFKIMIDLPSTLHIVDMNAIVKDLVPVALKKSILVSDFKSFTVRDAYKEKMCPIYYFKNVKSFIKEIETIWEYKYDIYQLLTPSSIPADNLQELFKYLWSKIDFIEKITQKTYIVDGNLSELLHQFNKFTKV